RDVVQRDRQARRSAGRVARGSRLPVQDAVEIRYVEIAAGSLGQRHTEAAGAREQKAFGRARRASATHHAAEVATDQRGPRTAEQLPGVMVRRLNAAARAHE